MGLDISATGGIGCVIYNDPEEMNDSIFDQNFPYFKYPIKFEYGGSEWDGDTTYYLFLNRFKYDTFAAYLNDVPGFIQEIEKLRQNGDIDSDPVDIHIQEYVY